MKTNSAPIADKTLWDTLGNRCRVEMHCIGNNVFEVYFHNFNSEIPKRMIGTIGQCNANVDVWLTLRKEEGFAEQLPSYNPDAWRA